MEDYYGYAVAVVLVLVLHYAGEKIRHSMANTWTVDGEGEVESMEETQEMSVNFASARLGVGYAALIPAMVAKTCLTFRDGSQMTIDGSFPRQLIGKTVRVSHNELYRYQIETLS